MHAGNYNNTRRVHLGQDTQGVAQVAIADIFQFSGSCIVEHWDITQERPANPVNRLRCQIPPRGSAEQDGR
ncbi:hypothetical protein BGZ57DRAFT_914870 [Hyaloscypha finlandica]|nr:hypothetical protein BGZ57DRAFT_914870 [Hyaloscypha finlandica]